MNLGKNIKAARLALGITQEDLATRLNLSKASISKYESGSLEPNSQTLLRISQILKISIDSLLENEQHISQSPTKPRRKGVRIPVLGRVQAGMPVEAMEEILDYEEITEEMAATGEFFGLYVRGDSMRPDFKPDDIVIVKQQPTADNGDIVVALVNGDDATIKKFKYTPNGIALIPINESYPTLYYTNQQIEDLPVRIIGKVVELRRTL